MFSTTTFFHYSAYLPVLTNIMIPYSYLTEMGDIVTKKITIGIPRSFLYYKYKYLWETFFNKLGVSVIVSPNTNKDIMADGINYSIDECCLSSKIYMGHVYSLVNKVDYILVPRFCSFGSREAVCTKFNAMYDIVRNTFDNVKLIHYNVDVLKKKTEFKGFLKMGKMLNKNIIAVINAYLSAKREQKKQDFLSYKKQMELLNIENKLKILVISHSYNTYDKLIGNPIIKYLEKFDVTPIYADKFNDKEISELSKNITTTLHWTYSKELVGAIEYVKDKIDGIMFVSTFPCGPDSLVNELCIRKIKNIPMLNIIIDEHQGEAGIHTRIESFVDIIKTKRKLTYE